jgi:methionine-rich copper-binding protein CopC
MPKFMPIAAVALLGMAGSAAAHPLPKSTAPKPNEVLTASPSEIRMDFSEGLVAVFSGVEVDDAAGKAVETGTTIVDPKNDKEMIVPLKAKLAPGSYTVKWHAVGTDTHRVTGHYAFQVKM